MKKIDVVESKNNNFTNNFTNSCTTFSAFKLLFLASLKCQLSLHTHVLNSKTIFK